MSFYSHYVFPRVLDMVMSGDEFQKLRKSLLADVSGNVFEIGFGTGLNLPHYPSNVKRITTVDPNPGARKLAERRMAQSPIEVEYQTLSDEALNLPGEGSGLRIESLDNFYLKKAPKYGAYIYRGVAVK